LDTRITPEVLFVAEIVTVPINDDDGPSLVNVPVTVAVTPLNVAVELNWTGDGIILRMMLML